MGDLEIVGGAGASEANLTEMRRLADRLDQLADELRDCRRPGAQAASYLQESAWISPHTAGDAAGQFERMAGGGQHSLGRGADRAHEIAGAIRRAARIYAGAERESQEAMALAWQFLGGRFLMELPLFHRLSGLFMSPLWGLTQWGGREQAPGGKKEVLTHWLAVTLAATMGSLRNLGLRKFDNGPDGMLSPQELAEQLGRPAIEQRNLTHRTVTTSTGTSVRSAPTLSVEGQVNRIGKLHPASNPDADKEYRIEVDVLTKADGSKTYQVFLPGMQADGAPTNPADIAHVLAAVGGGESELTIAIEDSLKQAGAQDGDGVILAGHSAGGMAATAFLGTAAAKRYDIKAVATYGAPVGLMKGNKTTQMLHVVDRDDPIPGLDGAFNEAAPNRVTVRGGGSLERAPEPEDFVSEFGISHNIEPYEDLGQQIDRETDEPSTRQFKDTMAAATAGTVSVTTHSYVTRLEPRPLEIHPSPPPEPKQGPGHEPGRRAGRVAPGFGR